MALRKYGFKANKCDGSLFIYNSRTHRIFVLAYVEDIIITGSSFEVVFNIIKALNQEFSVRDLGQLNYFLGVEVKRTMVGGLHLSQTKYVKDLLVRDKMHSAKGVSSLMMPGQKLLSYGSRPLPNAQEYKSIVGALQYVTITRP